MPMVPGTFRGASVEGTRRLSWQEGEVCRGSRVPHDREEEGREPVGIAGRAVQGRGPERV